MIWLPTSKRRQGVHRKLAENNFAYLLVGLLFFLLLIPVLRLVAARSEDADTMRVFLTVGFCLLTLISVWGLQGDRRIFRFGLGLAALQSAFVIYEQFAGGAGIQVFAGLTMLAFSGLSVFLGGRQVFSGRRADANTLIGSVCVYLLLGLIWAIIYALFVHFRPEGAFNGMTIDKHSSQFDNFLYFSFATLTSTGYGDITPLHPVLRTLAYLEMIAGQFYMAILVAGLLSLFINQRSGS